MENRKPGQLQLSILDTTRNRPDGLCLPERRRKSRFSGSRISQFSQTHPQKVDSGSAPLFVPVPCRPNPAREFSRAFCGKKISPFGTESCPGRISSVTEFSLCREKKVVRNRTLPGKDLLGYRLHVNSPVFNEVTFLGASPEAS